MLKLILIVFCVFEINAKLFPIEEKYPLLGNVSPPGTPWPYPQSMENSSLNLVYLSQSQFNITTNMESCDIIVENIRRYMDILFPPKINFIDVFASNDSSKISLTNVFITIKANSACPLYPDSDTDESYDLRINGTNAQIRSETVWGALRGLETFSQLTFILNDETLVLNDSTVIKDFPRFKYRGLMIDTARHFIPVPVLKKEIDAMSYNKFNVFHWHLVDDQSFPFESLKFPQLTQNGRYSRAHVYKQSDIKAIISHARLRGIRVIPEFDSPGHVAAFGLSFPEFITVCWNDSKPYQPIFSVQAKAEIFNPTVEALYPILKDLLGELKGLFPDDYVHLGMDEVYYACWKSNPNITEWMSSHNFTEYHQLEAYYSERILQIAKDLNKKVTIWQDVYDNGVKPSADTQIQIWKDTKTLPEHSKWNDYLFNITRDGYKAILSSPWYLNFISYGYQDWYRYYEIEPLANFTGTEEQSKLLIGGEACIWSEYIDGSNIDSRLWPRASAVAERLWSASSLNSSEDAKFRLDEHRCRMLRRGIPASPVLNGYCGNYEVGMDNSVVFDAKFNYASSMIQANSFKRLIYNFKLLSLCSIIIIKLIF